MGSWLAVMWGQGIRPRTPNPLYGFQDPARVDAFLDASAGRVAQAARALPDHEAFLKARGMWAGDAAKAA
jgi:tryptophan halogenase